MDIVCRFQNSKISKSNQNFKKLPSRQPIEVECVESLKRDGPTPPFVLILIRPTNDFRWQFDRHASVLLFVCKFSTNLWNPVSIEGLADLNRIRTRNLDSLCLSGCAIKQTHFFESFRFFSPHFLRQVADFSSNLKLTCITQQTSIQR